MKRLLLIALGLGLLVGGWMLGWSFQSANLAVIDIDLLWMTIEDVSVWKLVLSAFALGATLVLLLAVFFYMRGAILRRRYRATIRRLESELHQMRSLPLSEEAAEAPPALAAAAEGGS